MTLDIEEWKALNRDRMVYCHHMRNDLLIDTCLKIQKVKPGCLSCPRSMAPTNDTRAGLMVELKHLRHECGMTSTDLAELFGVYPKTFLAWENRGSIPWTQKGPARRIIKYLKKFLEEKEG